MSSEDAKVFSSEYTEFISCNEERTRKLKDNHDLGIAGGFYLGEPRYIIQRF